MKYLCTACDYVYDSELGDPTVELNRVLHSKTYLKIGFVRFVG